MLSLSILGIIIFTIQSARKLKLSRGHWFSNAVKILLFISDSQYYVPAKLSRTTGSIHPFIITGKLTPECIKLKINILWDVIELDWKEVDMTMNGSEIYQLQSLCCLEINSKLDALLSENPCFFILC